MATREENLEKIKNELEKLSDEELEKIAGGWGFFGNNNGRENERFESCDKKFWR